MMFGWVSFQDTEEIAESLVIMIAVFRNELKDKGSDSFRNEIEKNKLVREFSRNDHNGVEEYSFYFDGKLKEFFLHIIDERKSFRGFGLHITAEDQRYYGFRLYCDLLTGVATVNASDSMLVSINGQRATRKARKLCKMFARKYKA
jgi:hypothetical protein